ncbi:MAG TPA: methyltransferase [Polyangiaceae bacterium]
MRYELRPETLGERAALWLDAIPLPALEMLVPLVKVRAIMAGVRLGIFECLARGKLDARALAEKASLDPKSLVLLLRVLVAAGYVVSDGERYWLAPAARKSLVNGGRRPLCAYVEFNYAQWQFVEELENTLRVGRGIDFHRTLLHSSVEWRSYQRAMLELCRPACLLAAARVPIRAGARRLLDLGGAHGLLGAAICRAHPPLRSLVLDLPEALPEARALAQQEGIEDVVEHRASGLVDVDFDSSAPLDAILLSNVLHNFSKPQVKGLLRRAYCALPNGGTIAIWEAELPESDSAPNLVRDALALYFRVTSSGPGCSPTRLGRWLSRAGFQRVRSWRSRRAPGWVLLHARRS